MSLQSIIQLNVLLYNIMSLHDHVEQTPPSGLQEHQEEEVQKLLGETFTNNEYNDQQLNSFLLTHPMDKDDKISRNPSVATSETSQIQPYQQEHSMYKSSFAQSQPPEQLQQEPQSVTQLQQIEQDQIAAFAPISTQVVTTQYSMHLINEDKVTLSQNYEKGVPYYVTNHIKSHRKIIAGVQVFFQSNTRTFVVWTFEGEVIVFLPNSEKRIQFQPFESQISALSISPNLEMIAIGSTDMEFAIYRVRQPIQIEQTKTYRLLAKPVLFHKVDHKTILSNIVQIQFLPSGPDIECVVLDEFDEISSVKIQKRLLKNKAHFQLLPITFTTVFMFKLFTLIQPTHQTNLAGIVISSNDAVTMAIIRPKFQLIFVREQTNRSNIIKQGRVPFIDFCSNRLMIVWDKLVEIIKVEANGSERLEYTVRTDRHYFFAENSLAVGFLSATLLYQFSRTGLRVYSINQFSYGSFQVSRQKQMKYSEIYHQQIALQRVPQVGSFVGDILTNAQPPLAQLRYFSQKISTTLCNSGETSENNYLVYASDNHLLDSLKFLSYKTYVSRVIDAEGNWRQGLKILERIYEGSIYQLDSIDLRIQEENESQDKHLQEFKSVCQQYVLRFVQKTKNIIRLDRGSQQWNTEDIQNQESLFLCDFLLRTDNCQFLMDQIVPKMESVSINFAHSLEAYILLKKVRTMGHQNIDYYFSTLDAPFLSKLIYSLDVDNKQLNQIKSNAIRKKMYLEFMYLCTQERDFYTPFVILMAMYQEQKDRHLIILLLYFLKKSISGQKMPTGNYSIDTHKLILKEVITKILTPEVYEQIFKIAPKILFQQVLPSFFLPQTLPCLNSLQSDNEIRQQFTRFKLQSDIIKSLIIGNLPKESAQTICKGDYWLFVLKLFSRSLIVRMDILQGLHYLTTNNLIDNLLVREVISKREIGKQLELWPGKQKFADQLSGSEYIQLQVLLRKISKQYIQAIELIMSCAANKRLIYPLLEEIVTLLSQKQLYELSLIIKKNIRFMAEDNISRLEWLLTTYYSKEQDAFLEVMKPYPELQLSLMSQIFKGKNSEDHQLRISYLRLLAQLGYTSRAQKQIFTNLYPLDQSLEICKQYGILRGEAYIYERSGNVTSALKTHFQTIDRQIQLIDEKEWTEQLLSSTIYQTLRQTMRVSVRICKNISQRNDYQSQVYWMRVVEMFQSLKLKSTFNHFLICRVINQKVFPELFQQIISNVELSSILKYIQENIKSLEFNTVRLLFILLIKAYSYENEMLSRCRCMMVENVDDFRDFILHEYRKGFATSAVCSVCGCHQDLVIRYPCKHQVHPYCTTNIKICEVCSQQDHSYKIKQIINKQEMKFDLSRLIREPDPINTQRLSRRQRLIQFQSLNQNIDKYTRNQLLRG